MGKYLTTLIAAALICAGCFPAPKPESAPGIAATPPVSEYERARARYRRNRMVPPAHYVVSPKPPRNNDFGEFDESLYTGLDRQPALPPLPGDMLDGISAMVPASAAGSGSAFAGQGFPVTSAPSAPAPQGVLADGHFFPVEQLVYGGANGEPDSPDVYRLQPRDVILVTVRDHPEFSGSLTLQADGTVRVPNTPDPIAVRGMTAPEAADEIRRNIAVYVRGDCVVRVQANRARGGHYFVFGDVRQPGRFPMGMEEIRLADAVMAANFETNPTRLDRDEELTPAFPASSPLGASLPPETADMARVMLITPHRSQPARSTHDLRRALLGHTADNPLVRPGQIIVVPSLDPEKNFALGLDMPDLSQPPAARMPGQGFSTASSPARLPEVLPYAEAPADWGAPRGESAIEANLRRAYETQANEEAAQIAAFPAASAAPAPAENYATEYAGEYAGDYAGQYAGEYETVREVESVEGYRFLPGETVVSETIVSVESVDPVLPPGAVLVDESAAYGPTATARGRRLRKAPFATVEESVVEISPSSRRSLNGWKKGF